MADASNETEWAADRKVGFAMGILLIGVVAALFFRNEPLTVTDVPSVEREELIDARLRDRDVAVYTDDPTADPDEPQQRWTLPELLNEFGTRDADVALPIGAGVPPVDNRHGPEPAARQRPGDSDRPAFRPPVEMADTESPPAAAADGFELPDFDDDTSDGVEPPAEPDPGDYDEYTVRYGDTLSGIADRLLGSPARYREIYDANRDSMESPDRLTVGAVIRIPRL